MLIITSGKVDRELRRKIHDKLFPVSISICSFIDFIIVNEKDWEESPSYYALTISIKDEVLAI